VKIWQTLASDSLHALARSSRERRGASIVAMAAVLLVCLTWASVFAVLIRGHAAAIAAETRVLERMSLGAQEHARYLLLTIQTFSASADRLFQLRPKADPRDDPEFLILADSLRRQSGGMIDVGLITVDGELEYPGESMREALDSASLQGRTPLLSDGGRQLLYVGQPLATRDAANWLLPVFYPLSEHTHGVNMLVATIDSRSFERLYEESRIKPNGTLTLVHRDGTVLARTPDPMRYVGKSIAQGKLWTETLPSAPSATRIMERTLIDARDRLVSHATLPDFPLVVITSSAMGDVLAEWRQSAAWTVAIGLIMTLLTALVGWRLILLLSKLAQTRAQVEDQALRDALTGLPNRRMFHDRLSQALKQADRKQHSVALLFIDLDLFKEVNDTMGHTVGDLLLKDAAGRLISSVRESDTIARLGGDEFTVIMTGLSGPRSVERVAETVLTRLAQPFRLGQEVAWISASVGITFYPEDAGNAEDLIKNADQAMYAAKAAGRNRYSYFTQSMQVEAQSRKRLVTDLRAALASEQFRLFYQPIVDLRSGKITKAEALIRWQHPDRGLIMPNDFISVLEETGLMTEVGDWVFRQAATQVQRWRRKLDSQFQVSINKSPAQFRLGVGTLGRWQNMLDSLQLPGNSIAIEITEGLLMDVNQHAESSLLQISRAGIGLSLDDFGTGYSSLSYLKKFDIDSIKIDRSFVDGMEHDASNVALCEAMIVMAHKLGLRVIAEGVENIQQRDMLNLIGCDFAQGFVYSAAVPPEEFEQMACTANAAAQRPEPVLAQERLSAR
jgi:diguanylate cyclase (GGDEF)-like protein